MDGTRTLLVALALVGAAWTAGCAQGPADEEPPASGNETWTSQVAELGTEDLELDGEAMMDLVERQVRNESTGETRYRVPGTEGHREAVPVLEGMVETAGYEPSTSTFEAELPRELGTVNLTNVYGVREGTDAEAGEIWIGAHWDSRAWADRDGEPCSGPPVEGANDGAAAVAVAVHVAEQLPATERTVRVALFDGEDQGCEGEKWAVGSEHAAKRLEAAGALDTVDALVLVDMPGDPDLTVHREGNSERHAPRLTNLAFEVADHVDADAFVNESGRAITDDHVGFLERGVPAVDLIHNEPGLGNPFPDTWHTTDDTMENLSPASLEQVARVTAGTVLGVDEDLHRGGAYR